MIDMPLSFSYYAGKTADKMGIPKEETVVRACVELMFNAMLEHGRIVIIKDVVQKHKQAIDETINWIGPRYSNIKRYADDFLQNSPKADRDALAVAMLCTGFTDQASLFAPAIPATVIDRAEDIMAEAEKIAGIALYDGNDPSITRSQNPDIEATFLAHGLLSDMLNRTGEFGSFEDYNREDFQYLIDNILTPIQNYAHQQTKWGKDIIGKIEEHRSRIDQAIRTLPASKGDKSAATVIPFEPR